MHSGRPRIVSVDYGTRRVGLSIADPLRMFAQPLDTYSPESAIEKLVAIHQNEKIEVIVIGWPLEEDGSEGCATRRVNEYIRRLLNRMPDVDVVRWDERYTSEEAKTMLRGRSYQGKRGLVDQVASGIILQEYLDAISETTGPD
ncbi:MAG: Holliday junction resolvase RuvX [Rhodothermaceae bacterium]|nr:Holliday junction resolvase RuvX [Rhodothermaceae bacterium]MYH07427.1 Holliday junction resolvase RuvX [Rhodothermaceae bacterium]